MTQNTGRKNVRKARDIGKCVADASTEDTKEGRKKTKTTTLTESIVFSPHSLIQEDCARRMLHELSGKLLVPTKYTDAEDPSKRYWVGTIARFFWSKASVGLSQIGMTNEKLHMANLRGGVEAEKL
ncbi:unnamed protein product [Linum trigynum]|uniref:Uncharacterized protein n=1 Tax=Linum trigynum TaxID=586398 RepID=A0AAV2GBZ0_9ROSI